MTENEVITLLSSGDRKTLKKVYTDHRSAFIAFSRKFSLATEDILDAYQDTMVILQQQALEGRLENLTCTLRTYIFSIGKRILYEKIRVKNKRSDIPLSISGEYNYKEIVSDYLNDKNDEELQRLKKVFLQLGKKCQEVLTLFYYRGFTNDEIAETLDYENKNVVKSQKSRCLKKLKELFKQK
ncbi:RNA polymerase sigma factor [Pseudotenacibaculum haliotis]|uniref:RNA polymerase sigma factor n=1 Tax=Pseudotenacibaculum haliotis TaxID=1862138 RepID=A0ABW5LM13_9FLAO